MSTETTCITCGAPITGEFCAQCGERRADAHDLSLRRFLTVSLASLTNLDARGYRSIRHLIRQPGRLTADYVEGRRSTYLSPVQLFLVANVLFFIATSFVPALTFDTPLAGHLSHQQFGPTATIMVRERLAEFDSVDYARFETQFNYAADQQARSLVILFAPMFAFALGLMRVTRREPAGLHVVFALHFVAFSLLLFIAVGVVLGVLLRIWPQTNENSGWIAVAVIVVITAWLTPALRRVYRSAWPAALVQAFVLAFLFIPFLGVFRRLLFYTVLFTT